MDAFWQAPPVTRTLVAAVVATSIAFYSNILSPYLLIYNTSSIFYQFPPQLWRLITPFCITGPKFNMLMDPVALWQYSSTIETGAPRFQRKGDYFVYIVFIMTIIFICSGIVLNSFLFIDPLLLALAFTYAHENPNRTQTFYVVSFPARYLPFIMLGLTFVMTGGSFPRVYNQATGLLAGHAYDFLTRIWPEYGGGTNWVEKYTPLAVRRAFGDGAPGVRAVRNTGFGTVYSSATNSSTSTSTSARTSAFSSSSSWGGRGQGRRLGGD